MIDLVYPQILRTATNSLFTKDSGAILKMLVPIALGLFVMYTIQSLCKYYVSYQGHMMGAYMERDMRQQLFEHYETLSFSYYNSHNSGQMMSKLVSDLFDIAEFVPPRTREPVYLSDQGCRLLYLFVLHQLAACHSTRNHCNYHVCVFDASEQPDAGNFHGEP